MDNKLATDVCLTFIHLCVQHYGSELKQRVARYVCFIWDLLLFLNLSQLRYKTSLIYLFIYYYV